MKKILFAVVCLMLLPALSFAATATSTQMISANVLAAGTCSIVGASWTMGDVTPPIAANVDGGIGCYVTCPSGTPYTVSLDSGYSFNTLSRSMVDASGNTLAYNIYTDSNYSTIFGDGIGGTGTISGSGNGNAQYVQEFVRIPAQPTPPAGYYSDTTVLTITY